MARAACSFFECALTSSMEIRPPGPVPWTCAISTPISRARRRVDGAAGTGSSVDVSVGVGAGGASSTTGATACGIGVGAGSTAGTGAGGASSATGAAAVSTARMGCPTAMVSPCWTRISVTVPSTEEGTSMTALSVSSSMTVWSSARRSPTSTRMRITSPLSMFSPKSGSANCTGIAWSKLTGKWDWVLLDRYLGLSWLGRRRRIRSVPRVPARSRLLGR